MELMKLTIANIMIITKEETLKFQMGLREQKCASRPIHNVKGHMTDYIKSNQDSIG